MKHCHFLVPRDLNERKLERISRKANVSSGMIHGSSSKLISCFWLILADCQNQVFSLSLNTSAMYEHNCMFYESKPKVAHLQ